MDVEVQKQDRRQIICRPAELGDVDGLEVLGHRLLQTSKDFLAFPPLGHLHRDVLADVLAQYTALAGCAIRQRAGVLLGLGHLLGYPSIPDTLVRAFRIPVPPLEVQREIVRILDTFTELEAELEARRRQYAHYAEHLLVSADEVPRVNLGDVAKIVRGASPRPIQSYISAEPDGVPWIKNGDVPMGGKVAHHS